MHAATPSAQRLGPTLALCLLLAALFVGLVARLTRGFEFWTYEDLRRHAAAVGELRAPALRLLDEQGHPRTVFASAGPGADTFYLVDFIYTRCITVCQVLGGEYFRMQEALREGGPPSVRLLSISIDPAHDRPPELAAHGRLHRADPVLWTLGTPVDPRAGAAALRSLGVIAIPDGVGGFAHNGAIHLIDSRGRVHGIFDYEQWQRALAAAQRLAREPSP